MKRHAASAGGKQKIHGLSDKIQGIWDSILNFRFVRSEKQVFLDQQNTGCRRAQEAEIYSVSGTKNINRVPDEVFGS
ncbi:MAG: hypothetical protein Q4C96_10410 [Planctomycetia bacterium]|nr:hypothetical protein [Planctomycetia bacterium]